MCISNQIFVKRSHKDIKTAFIVLYICLFIVCIIGTMFNIERAVAICIFLIGTLILFLYLVKLFGTFGIYINGNKVIYKTFRIRKIDIHKIVGIKIIKAEAQVNIAWSSFNIKSNNEHAMYSMIFLSDIENKMKQYPYGDLEFLRRYRKSIVMYSVYDERLIKFFKDRIPDVQIID